MVSRDERSVIGTLLPTVSAQTGRSLSQQSVDGYGRHHRAHSDHRDERPRRSAHAQDNVSKEVTAAQMIAKPTTRSPVLRSGSSNRRCTETCCHVQNDSTLHPRYVHPNLGARIPRDVALQLRRGWIELDGEIVASLDPAWAIEQLQAFLHASDQVTPSNSPNSGVMFLGTVQRETDRSVAELAHVAEQIVDRVLPEWRNADDRPTAERHKERWNHLRDWAARGIAALKRQEELREKLGDNAPTIDAGQLHPWIWEGARSLWHSRHYAQAVTAAAIKLNAETQNKVGRRDLGETKLFQESFSINPPEADKPRLRLSADDGSQSYKDRQTGAIQLASGLYIGLRNIASHEIASELPEHEALEQLAAFSVLARMVDGALVER